MPHKRFPTPIGRRFGRLVVEAELPSIKGRRRLSLVCDCGVIVTAMVDKLRAGRTKSCGCARVGHGWSKHPLYHVWRLIKQRCGDPNHRSYRSYGARGIAVCAEWSGDDPVPFITWALSHGWKPGLEIDRRENDRGYSPDNCRCITQLENANNRRRPTQGDVASFLSLPA